jgi:hypothetical protein
VHALAERGVPSGIYVIVPTASAVDLLNSQQIPIAIIIAGNGSGEDIVHIPLEAHGLEAKYCQGKNDIHVILLNESNHGSGPTTRTFPS